MPVGPRHRSQGRKNLALMAALIAVMALVYAVALMKMGAGAAP